MPYDPNYPALDAEMTAPELREQFASLKTQIDAIAAGPGFHVRGEWAPLTTYQPGDVVSWTGQIYLAATTTTEPPDVAPDWSPLSLTGPPGPQGPAGTTGAPGPNFAMQGDWLDYQTYVPGDVVAYNNLIYVTMTGAAGTPPDQSANWKLLSIVGTPGAPGEVTTGQLNAALQSQCPRNVDWVQFIDGSSFSAEGQAIVAKINELLAALHHPI